MLEPPSKNASIILAVILLLAIILPFRAEKPAERQIERQNSEFYMVQGNSIMAVSQPAQFNPAVYGAVIDCLEKYESGGNEYAMGEAGEIGCMQFMPSTWDMYCVGKYHLRNNIWDCGLQRLCADLMLQDKISNLNHWTTARYCNGEMYLQ
jgi:hypothetical protein